MMPKTLFAYTLLTIILLFFSESTNAALVSFDDLQTPNNAYGSMVGPIPSNYMGVTWEGWQVIENSSYNSSYHNSSVFPSLPNAAYNVGPLNLQVYIYSPGDSLMSFESAYFWFWAFSDSWGTSSATLLNIFGYRDEVQIGNSTFITLSLTPTLVPVNLTGVDEVRFQTNAEPVYWLMDNANITLTQLPVPEPTTILLLGPALAGLVGFKRKLQKK